MEWVWGKQGISNANRKNGTKTNAASDSKKTNDCSQNMRAANHGTGSFIARNIEGRSDGNGALRAERAFLREEPVVQRARQRLRSSRKAKSHVAEVRPHASFLVESYDRAARRGREEKWVRPWVESEIEKRREKKRTKRKKVLDSEILRKSLRMAGVRDSNNWSSDPNIDYEIPNQAHHIVEAHDKRAESARKILRNASIYINSAANGVFLPSEHIDGTGDATIHLGSHVPEYANCVNRALKKAVSRTDPGTDQYRDNVLKRLSEIRRVLLSRNVPINKNVDSDYAPKKDITIADIFLEEKLFDRVE